MTSTDVVQAGDGSPYAVLRMEASDIQDLISENLGGDSLSPRDLDRVKVPAGGAKTWEVPTISGIEPAKFIEGVIIHRATRRAYWPRPFDGSGEQPDCFSDDGQVGIGEPGGPCSECPYNEFGSSHDGVSKACKEVRQLFVLTAESLIPIVVNVPPGSLANVKSYFLRLLRAQLRPTDVVTHIGLEGAESKSGISYSRVTLAAGPRLDPEASARLNAYADALQPAFRAAARVDQSEVNE